MTSVCLKKKFEAHLSSALSNGTSLKLSDCVLSNSLIIVLRCPNNVFTCGSMATFDKKFSQRLNTFNKNLLAKCQHNSFNKFSCDFEAKYWCPFVEFAFGKKRVA